MLKNGFYSQKTNHRSYNKGTMLLLVKRGAIKSTSGASFFLTTGNQWIYPFFLLYERLVSFNEIWKRRDSIEESIWTWILSESSKLFLATHICRNSMYDVERSPMFVKNSGWQIPWASNPQIIRSLLSLQWPVGTPQ